MTRPATHPVAHTASATARYTPFLRHAHWASVALVLCAYLSIYARKLFERGSPERLFTVEAHFLLGLLLLLITLPRIAVRLRHTAPPIAPAPGLAARIAAKAVHLALFLFLVVQPLLGIATRMVSGKGIGLPLTEWAIPGFATPQPELAKSIEHLHVFVGEAFYYVIGAHVLAALWHWWVKRDNVMQRML